MAFPNWQALMHYAPVACATGDVVGGRAAPIAPGPAAAAGGPAAAFAFAARAAAARNTVDRIAGGSKMAAPTIQPTRISLNCKVHEQSPSKHARMQVPGD